MSLMAVSATPLAGGDSGVQQTVRAMRRLIEQGKKDPVIHELAAKILQSAGTPAFDWRGETRAIGEAVARNVRFTRDITGKETLHSAREIVRLGIGDCDDFTILICSLLETIGCRTRIVTISNHAEDPGKFSHVYPEAHVDGEWIPVDYARRSPAFGKGPENYFRKRVWEQGRDAYEDIAGMGESMRTRASLRARPLPGLAADLMLPRAYRPDSIPQFRGRRRMPAVIGVGHYGKSSVIDGMGGLGDFSTIANGIATIVNAGTAGVADILRSRQPGAYDPFYNLPAPNAALTATVPSSVGGISTGVLLLGGLGVLALFLSKRGGG